MNESQGSLLIATLVLVCVCLAVVGVIGSVGYTVGAVIGAW